MAHIDEVQRKRKMGLFFRPMENFYSREKGRLMHRNIYTKAFRELTLTCMMVSILYGLLKFTKSILNSTGMGASADISLGSIALYRPAVILKGGGVFK